MDASAAPRKLVRRYHLTYDGKYHASFLDSVQAEGRCGKGGESSEPIAEELRIIRDYDPEGFWTG